MLNWLKKMPGIISIAYTYLIVLIGWVFFRAETFPEAVQYLQNMFDFTQSTTNSKISLPNDFIFFLIAGICFSFFTLSGAGKKVEYFIYNKKHPIREHYILSSICLILLVISISYIFASGFNPFIYFRF